ncbi:MAG: hypothetical protein CMH28_02630 [Micavibrio sp.]|nr:hypothetical protein [Micavibrio sp.]
MPDHLSEASFQKCIDLQSQFKVSLPSHMDRDPHLAVYEFANEYLRNCPGIAQLRPAFEDAGLPAFPEPENINESIFQREVTKYLKGINGTFLPSTRTEAGNYQHVAWNLNILSETLDAAKPYPVTRGTGKNNELKSLTLHLPPAKKNEDFDYSDFITAAQESGIDFEKTSLYIHHAPGFKGGRALKEIYLNIRPSKDGSGYETTSLDSKPKIMEEMMIKSSQSRSNAGMSHSDAVHRENLQKIRALRFSASKNSL